MWNRFNGKPKDSKDELPSQMSRRNDDEERYHVRRVDSIASSNSSKKSSTRPDDRNSRGFNPTSTSYTSTTQGQYPGAASASIASSPATASESNTKETYVTPGLVRNASLADQMPRSSASRSSRDQEETRKIRDKTRDKTERSDGRDRNVERRQKRDKGDKKDLGSRTLKNGLGEEEGATRGAAFSGQVASSGFSPFPGQYDRAVPGLNNVTPEHPAMSSHVQDQFPGQFPTQSSAPYRPPLAASEGGPGLAAEYYGDDGQSVAEQPGNRTDTPSLIIGAEPHLQPALAVAAPPPEPSASGSIGAAASFFSGEVEEDEAASTHGQYNSFPHSTNRIRPNSNYHSSSAPVVPIIGGTEAGSAIGNFNGSQNLSHQQHQDYEVSIGGAPSIYSTTTTTRPPSQAQGSYHSSISRPPKPGKQQSQSSGIPISTVGIAGAAGMAAAAYGHNHHSPLQDPSSMSQNSTTSMAQRHRNHGPFGALMNFFKDPEGVAQFEEYSEIIGVCRHCFAPGSSPRDAPRKHLHKRRSDERYGSKARVDKDSRYYSSENEKRRKNKSWLTTGLGGYELAKVGQNLLSEKNDFGDTYSEKTGRFSPEERNRRARRRSRSKERVEIGTIDSGKSDRKGPRDDPSTGTKRMASSARRHSRTRPRSKVRTTGLAGSAIGAALESSVVASSSQRRSRSPKGTHGKGKHKSPVISPERLHKTKHKKRDRGFFGFGNGSSSSSSLDLAYTRSQDKHRSSTKSHGKSKDDKKAEAALLGLGAATAALALSDGRQGHRRKGVRELVGVKETKDHDGHGSGPARRSKKSSEQQDDELWESAAEDDYESVNSDLAYGAPGRRDSRASLSSQSSGTNKWGWRWGKKRNRRASTPRRASSDYDSFPAVAGAGLKGSATMSQDQHQGSAMDNNGGLPLQHVYPVPTSDPSRFDVGRGDSIVSSSRPIMSSRPEAVPLQHPRPVAPVSAAVYSSQTPYDHSFSAPTGPAMFSQTQYQHHLEKSDARQNTNEASMPGSFPRLVQQADDATHDFRLRRRDTSPARIGQDSMSNSLAPERRASTKVDSSAVRFDLTEEQEEKDRRERRRKRKEDKDRREANEQEKIESDRRASREQSRKKSGPRIKTDEAPRGSSEISWVGPAAAGIIGATIGAAAATNKSRSEEMREERRQRRQRERELEDEEDALSKSERRRRQKEQHDQDTAIKDNGRMPDEASTSYEYADHKKRSPERQEMSVWQEAASTKQTTSHENYRSFFTPIEVLNKSSDQVKITSANADADIDLEQVPRIVTVKPKQVHDLSDSPAFSLADTDDRIDPSKVSFPWQIPKLRLEEPTPPSTRGSTPIAQSKSANNTGSEEPRKESSSTNVKWEDEQTPEYTIIAPTEDRDESIESVSKEINGTDAVDISEISHERDLPVKETDSRTGSTTKTSPAPYGEDAEFAATLAASAEDAGFDPSIVINNPTYRRRDSPPGSNDRNMPGGFDDENDQRRNKKERRKKEKSSRRQRKNDDSRQRDDAVQDIISKTEEIEYQPSYQVLSDNHDDDLEDEKKTNPNKSKNGRKGSNPEGYSFEASEVGRQPPVSESGDVLGPTTEDIHSVTSSAPINDEADTDAEIRKKSKYDSTRFDHAMATVPHPSKTEVTVEPKPKPKDKREGSIWDRILGKTNGSLSQENGAKGVTDKAILEDPDRSKNTQKPRKGKSSRDVNNERDTKERSSIQDTTSQASDRSSQYPQSKDQKSSQPLALSDAGSVSQYLVHDLEPEQIEEKQPEPFLGMRPEPPPPPDIRAESEGLSSPLETASLPTTPRAEFDAQSRRFSDAEISEPSQTTAGLPSSPTAIPFHFRRSGRSSGTARSLPQTPIPSDNSALDLSPKQKTRPRSTEFKSSKEIRPLWLVERHRSHQEPRLDEVYPSLPSSHTTSRSSSVHDVEGDGPHERDKYESNEELEPIEVESAPMISTVSNPIQQSDLLDSEQATPTVSSFQDSKNIQVIPSLQANRDSSSEVVAEGSSHKSSSAMKSGVLHAILGVSTAIALNEAVQSNDLARSDQSREKNDDFEHGLDDMAVDAATSPQYNDTLDQQEDFVLQKTKKGKKNKRNPGQSVESSLTRAVETQPSTSSLNSEPLSPETIRQIQEQDAQDAVDSWSSVAVPSNEDKKGKKGKKGKRGKEKPLVERSLEESAPSPNTYQPPRDSPEMTMPAEGQEVDILTTGMSREQIVGVMTTAAHGADKNENKKSQSATAVAQEPLEIQEEEDPVESIGGNDGKNWKVLLHDKYPRGDSQTKTLPQDGFSQEDLHGDDLLQGNLTQHNLQEKSLPRHDLSHDQLPPLENHQETYPKGGFSQVSPSRDDFPHSQDPQNGRLEGDHRLESLPVLSSSSPATVNFIDPFSEKAPGDVLESPNANPASQEEIGRGDLPTVMLPPLELSPRATPSPDGDGHDLLEEQARIPGPTSRTYSDYKEMDIAAAETPSDIQYVADPSTTTFEQQQRLQDFPSQADQVDDGDFYAVPSKRKSKKSKKVRQSFLAEDLETPGIQEEEHASLSNVITSTAIGNDLPKVLNEEPPIETLQKTPKVTEDESVGFISNKKGKKGKKAKKGFSGGNGKAIEVEEGQESLPKGAVSETPKNPEAMKTTYHSAVVVSQPEALPIEHESLGSNGKKNGKKGKKSKPSVSFEWEKTTNVGDEKNMLSRVAAPQTPEYGKATELIDDSATHAPRSEVVEETTDLIDELTNQVQKPEVVDDESVGPSSEKKGEYLTKQWSETAGEAPVPDKIEHQFQRQAGARNDMNDRSSSLATTRTSQDVGAMLGLGETEASLGSEVFPIELQAAHTSQKPHDQIPSNDEQNLPVSYEPKISPFQDAPGKARDDEMPPAVGTSVASTNSAQAVQDMLLGESNADSAMDAKREVMVASAGMEETAFTVGPSEGDQLDWTAPKKKKKGKKGGKFDAQSSNEPETIDPAGTSGPLGAMDTLSEERPTAKPPIEENELDRDAPKKKKRGKKGEKSEELVLDEPEIMNPAEDLSAPATTNRPPLEQQPTAETIDEAFTKQSKKDKKNKKGKRKVVLRAVSDFRDEDEPDSVPPEVSQNDKRVKDLPTIVSHLREETEGNAFLTEAAQDDTRFEDVQATTRNSRNEVEPSVVPTELLQDDDQSKDRYAEDHLSVTSDIRDDPELKIISTDAPGDDKVLNLPANSMASTRAEEQAPEEEPEPAVPTELVQADATEKSREVPMEEEHYFVPPRGKRDKKKSKKSEKPSVSSLDDNEIPTLRDGHLAEIHGLRKDGIEQTVPSSNVSVVEEPEETAQKIQSDLDQDLTPSKTKKDKKKSKKSKTFNAVPPKRDFSPVLENESISKPEDNEGDAPKQTLPPSVEVFKEPEQSVESLPEEKKDREETEDAQPFGWETMKVTPQSEKDAAQRLNKDSEMDDVIYPSDAVGNPVMVQGKREEHGHEYIDPVSAYAAASEIPHGAASPRTPSIEQAAGDPKETTAPRLNTSQGNIVPAVEPMTNPLYTLEPRREDNKGSSISRQLTWEDEPSQDRRDVLKGSYATEDPSNPSIIPVSQDAESWSKPEISAQEIEPTDIVQPGMKSEEDQEYQGNVSVDRSSQSRDQIRAMVEAEQYKKSQETKSEKLSITEPEEARYPADEEESEWVTGISRLQTSEQALEHQLGNDVNTTGELRFNQKDSTEGPQKDQNPTLMEAVAVDEAKEEHLLGDKGFLRAEKSEDHLDQGQWDEYKIEDSPPSATSEPTRETVETFQTAENVPEIKSVPVLEVEMLDAQEQRDYNDEYAKELERQLSPSQDANQIDPLVDQADVPMFTQSSMNRPLAQPPALEDIIEESRSSPGPNQASPDDRQDDFLPSKSGKKGKKGKKSKRQQPIIWEDETATPSLEPESDQVAKPFIKSSEGPGPWDTDAAQPLDLDESIDQRSLEDRRTASPHGDFNIANYKRLLENDLADDYFTIQPSKPAEEDVGREENPVPWTEPPYSSRDRSPGQEPQTAPGVLAEDDPVKDDYQHEELRSHATDFHHHMRTEVDPAEKDVEDILNPARVKNIEEDTLAKQKIPARELSPQVLGQKDFTDQSKDLEIPIEDTSNEISPSRQHSLQRYSHEDSPEWSAHDEPPLVAKDRSASRDRSESRGRSAAALYLSELATETISRRDSKKQGKRDKKAKRTGRRTEFEAEIAEAESHLDRGQLAVEEQEHGQTPEPESATGSRQHYQTTTTRSPPSASYDVTPEHPVVGDLGQLSEKPGYRDSAIHVSSSPVVSEAIPCDRTVRDSGYPDTETSPTFDDEPERLEKPAELNRPLDSDESVGQLKRRHNYGPETDERQESILRDPLEISIEASADYDVSVSRPKERQNRSRRRSEAAYDSDDSADSGFDIQRRRRRQAMAAEPREPSPVSSTTKDRSSALFDSSPSAREEKVAIPRDQDVSPRHDPTGKEPTWSVDREILPQQQSREASRGGRSDSISEHAPESKGDGISTGNQEDTESSLFGGPRNYEDDSLSRSRSPLLKESRGRRRLNSISEHDADGSALHKEDKCATSDVGSPKSDVKGRRMRSAPLEDDGAGGYVATHQPISIADEEQGAVEERNRSLKSDELSTLSGHHSGLAGVRPKDRDDDYRTRSAASVHSETENSIYAIIRTPDQVRSASGLSYRSSATPPLRRVDRSASGDLRGRAKKNKISSGELQIDTDVPSSSSHDPITDKATSPVDMANVYEGWGDSRGQSPMSPTRPPSMRKRQSMQLLDLETRLDQIVSENRLLANQKLTAERALQELARDHSQERHAYEEAMQEHKIYLERKDSELGELKQIIEHLHDQAAHLTEVNEGLAASRGANEEHEQRYAQLSAEHAHTHEQWQLSARDLEDLKEQHTQLSTGMEDIVRHEVNVALDEKNLELRRLQSELENAKQQVQNLQQQLLASRNSDSFVERDEDYFDSQCQSLCQHVQQWVLRFSKFSDMKACYLASAIKDEKVVDRMENAILDGADVDDYLSDRVKRRDVFMSVVMTMIWEFIFTRYLFGMDREQRQKLKNLEKTLQGVGPIGAVHKWRATTLTLLMKREAFENQRATDTEAVVHEIYDTLATFLPPPSHLVGQIQDSLRKVIDTAVDLSIEMRTQRAEYTMLPPLQPEYDTNGDLARKVYFSALTMNERGGATSSNDALQEQHAVVRMVLFPLVVKNEDDDEQIVVCPAQVLTAEGSKGKKTVRVLSAQGGRSEASFAGSDVRMEGGMI